MKQQALSQVLGAAPRFSKRAATSAKTVQIGKRLTRTTTHIIRDGVTRKMTNRAAGLSAPGELSIGLFNAPSGL